MKKLVALILLVVLFAPNAVTAKVVDYGTIVWEGILANNNHAGEAIKVRYTLTGVVGDQVSKGKVNTYVKVLNESTLGGSYPHYIIPIVSGGSVKVEYLGDVTGSTYQETEGILGMSDTREIVQSDYGDMGYYVKNNYHQTKQFFVNENFLQIIGKDNLSETSELSYNHLANKNVIGKVYLPVSPNGWGETMLQIVTESEARKMIAEIKGGHSTRLIGKFFDETEIQDDIFIMKYKKLSKIDLEKKYGFADIYVKEGFYPEEALLEMLDRIYSRFPEGLIKEITDYYKAKGVKTYLKFTPKNSDLSGHFSDSGGKIVINYYTSIYNDFDDWVIAHEMGHYIHKYLNERYGYDKLKYEWLAINNGIVYDINAFNKKSITEEELNYFVRDYGKVSYSEDFATVFELIAGKDPVEFKSRVLKNPNLALKKKVDVLNKALVSVAESVSSTSNLWGRAIPQIPSSYAVAICKQAKDSGLIPVGERYEGLYTANITRKDFALLAVNLIEKETGLTIAEYAQKKGVKKEWYHHGSFSAAPATDGSTQGRVRSNVPFCDVSDHRIYDLHTLGVINGVSDKIFDPEGLLSRQQAAVIVRNIAKVVGKDVTASKSNFADRSEISSWAKSGVDFVSTKGLMGGTGNNRFDPKAKINYEQSYILLFNFYGKY